MGPKFVGNPYHLHIDRCLMSYISPILQAHFVNFPQKYVLEYLIQYICFSLRVYNTY